MAGLEVAGVVLGSIPLVISALEHYGEGVAVMKNMRDFEYVFDDIQTQFAASVGIYVNSCYQLLGPLNLPDEQMNELLDERNIRAWSEPKLQSGVQARLGPNTKVYISLMAKLNKRIRLFCKKLKLDDDLKPPWLGSDGSIDEKARRKFFKSTWTKIKGGFDAAKYATLLEGIDRDIDKISKLTSGGLQLEPLRAERKNRMQSIYWQNVRHQAERLFDSLSARFNPCACNQPHQANLRLDVRKENDGQDEHTRFAFLLTFEKSACIPQSLPWDWRHIEIESSQSLVTQQVIPITTESSRKTAHFAPSIIVSSSTQATSRSASPSLAAKIDNLCGALMDGSQFFQIGCCLGVLDDQQWQHHVYAVAGPGSNDQVSEPASLNEMICGARSITTRQKCTLALTLASSVLQLHDTPWLPRSWDTKDIFILKGKSGSILPSAYVSRTFDSPTVSPAVVKGRRSCVKNEHLFALGVALLEIAHGAPLMSLLTPEDLNDDGQQDSMTEFRVATRLADEIHEAESENYARAVLRCIRCNFDSFQADFGDQEFREKYFEGVIMPLQTDWEFVTGGKT
ncbi:hypothetical protein BDV95DRAFT_612491 [Massariosphaeria phaeospora]|uniref:DUF7580 domain-containing protein n=1 Tax=Massariosphaeria phaeospora TaxID=100035 RepID=A0A7C8HYY0_9PLEO|nr:hypothetical protein BDV95DRAFT_612491 [Massariosphaeria phaeospora]